MKYFILSLLTLLTFSSFAQTEIKIEDVKNHIGDSVKLTAKIYGGKYIESTQGTPTFLNVGDNYPNAPLTLVIWGDTRKQFNTAPETIYTGQNVTITGKIILYKNRPEIIITDPKQIQ
jgi:DNA/RNA endonuclease YhcR with UshA esterase domain